MKYRQTLTSAGWSLIGLIVSISVIKANPQSLFGWPLFILSGLMIPLAIKYYLKEKQINSKR